MISARDVQRTFETWPTLARDEEVLTLAALVHRALQGRGFICQVTFSRAGTGMNESKREDSASSGGEGR